jgi:PAS domain S-box-containing protein
MANRSHPSLRTENEALRKEVQKQRDQGAKLRLRLQRAEEALEAMRRQSDAPASNRPGGGRLSLRSAARSFRALLEDVGHGAAILHGDGTIAFCNATFARLFGLPLESAAGSSIGEALDPSGREALQRLLQVRETRAFEEVAVRGQDGEAIPACLSVATVRGDGGSPLFCVLATDLREQKRCRALADAEREARARESRYREAFERIEEAFCLAEVLCDERGEPCSFRCLAVNSAFERVAGKPCEELVSRPARELLPGIPMSRMKALGQVAAAGGQARHAERSEVLGRDFEFLAFRASEGPLCILVLDATERRRTQDALRESEVRYRAATDELRESNRRQNEFLGVLSHELRNPLTPIRNSLLLLDHAPPGSGQARRAQATIDRQVNQLVHLVDDLLDVARITRNAIRLQRARLSLDEVVRRAAEDHRPLFEKSGIHLEIAEAPEPVFVDADWARISQIVGNLLENAAKFTARGGSASISVEREPLLRRAIIRVKDTGSGMSAELVERLFQPFMQADRTLDRSRGGLGLGLAVAKGLVELHGGGIHAQSDGAGLGSEFVVSLPLDERELGCDRAIASPAAPGRSQRVLIIEDNADAADSLREVLELDAHVVEVAYDGPEGIAKARQFKPEVVLCDIGLPGMDGYEVARTFRADEALRGAFLVALSGYALPEDVRRAAAAGFRHHLAKPPSLEELESILGSVGPRSDAPAGAAHAGASPPA